ncbi:hypothetical protein K9N68_16780 [Kovacikia minuta CCNUW1]|uniref:hypothetical protein n=1 Tax=Kovacikia minuta TaxID=2931930 RepID=UPI001CCEA983|nr:hypothetical protein [Kovacikia minuta]UBF29339.1 hypothetical protein K9N68_16780 [Kovacikia minuta CCNUW1]
MEAHDHSPLFRLSYKILKYFLLFLFGFTLVCFLSSIFGAAYIASALITAFGYWLFRLSALVLILMATAIIFESIRY